MSVELKIKAKHLALEPAIIRKEEHKLNKQMRWYKQHHQIKTESVWSETVRKNHRELFDMHLKWSELNNHRTTKVRYESRATYLARAFISGTPYEKVEKKRRDNLTFKNTILPRVFSMVAKYGRNPIYKKWNSAKGTMVYDVNDENELMDSIKKWANV